MIIQIQKWGENEPEVLQTINDGRVIYNIESIKRQSEHLIPFEIPLIGMRVDYKLLQKDSDYIIDFVQHMKAVLDADLSIPIILDRDGWVIDGRHRLTKALFEEREKIIAVRFNDNPKYESLSEK